MKKILVAAALVAAFAMPALPSAAADSEDAEFAGVPVKCYFLPLLPECIDAWKVKSDEAKAEAEAKWEEATSK